MEFGELASMERLKQFFDAFNQKREILHILDRCIEADGVQIFIGEESGYGLLDDCSLVTTAYRVDDQVVGVLGVIGPTRMDYQRVIPDRRCHRAAAGRGAAAVMTRNEDDLPALGRRIDACGQAVARH